MSLPDTIFIFVLALIIFGPKKLPEIGRQIGRLVGEFRRASNEFKFQIEEELRHVDLNEKRTERQTIAQPTDDATQSNSLQASGVPIASPDISVTETLPVGQHPNIDSLDLSGLEHLNADTENLQATPEDSGDETVAAHVPVPPTVTGAAGSEPRTTIPYATVEPADPIPPADTATALGNGKLQQGYPSADEGVPALTNADADHG